MASNANTSSSESQDTHSVGSFIVNLTPQQAASTTHRAALGQTRDHYMVVFASSPRDTVALVRVNYLKLDGQLQVPERYIREIITPRQADVDQLNEHYPNETSTLTQASSFTQSLITANLPTETSELCISSSHRGPARHRKVMTIPLVPARSESPVYTLQPPPTSHLPKPYAEYGSTRKPLKSVSSSTRTSTLTASGEPLTLPMRYKSEWDDPTGRTSDKLDPCWYHYNYGKKAPSCQPPCKHAPSAVNDSAIFYVKMTGRMPPIYKGDVSTSSDAEPPSKQ